MADHAVGRCLGFLQFAAVRAPPARGCQSLTKACDSVIRPLPTACGHNCSARPHCGPSDSAGTACSHAVRLTPAALDAPQPKNSCARSGGSRHAATPLRMPIGLQLYAGT